MANMKQDLSTHRHGVSFADWSANEVKQNRTRERTQELTDLEVFQHALSQGNDEAWSQLFARFQGLVLTWAQNHPQRDLASRYYAPDFSVALAFERFWSVNSLARQLNAVFVGANGVINVIWPKAKVAIITCNVDATFCSIAPQTPSIIA